MQEVIINMPLIQGENVFLTPAFFCSGLLGDPCGGLIHYLDAFDGWARTSWKHKVITHIQCKDIFRFASTAHSKILKTFLWLLFLYLYIYIKKHKYLTLVLMNSFFN